MKNVKKRKRSGNGDESDHGSSRISDNASNSGSDGADIARKVHRDGYAVIRQAMPKSWIQSALAKVDSLGVVLRHGGLRAELNFALDDGPFGQEALIDNRQVRPVLDRLLGPKRKVQRIGGIISFPDSDDQCTHRDGDHLYSLTELQEASEEEEAGPAASHLPPHSVHLWVPLTAYSIETGATAFFPGSHRVRGEWTEVQRRVGTELAREVRPELQIGDAIVYDDRIFHYGPANKSSTPRTVVFASFARRWYADGVAEGGGGGERGARAVTGWAEIE